MQASEGTQEALLIVSVLMCGQAVRPNRKKGQTVPPKSCVIFFYAKLLIQPEGPQAFMTTRSASQSAKTPSRCSVVFGEVKNLVWRVFGSKKQRTELPEPQSCQAPGQV